jgi:UDPglucose 6-dehydrogenase
MNLSVVGTGYVGLVAGTCFAESGHHVVCVDCDEAKIHALRGGEIPIYEPGLAEIVQRNVKAHRLSFTTDLREAVKQSRMVFIAVGTPQAPDGSADLTAILDVAANIAKAMDGYRVIVMKSTVPVGTYARVIQTIKANTGHPFDYASNPEFMKEGAAVEDFTRPDRVVIGTTSSTVAELMREVYGPFMRRDERVFVMDPASAEMAKYAANALLATKISFINEIAGLCERFGADIEAVRRGVGSDSRIGTAFLYAGVGYGGSCFPKDVSALIATGRSLKQSVLVCEAVNEVNQRQRRVFAQGVIDHFGAACRSTTVGVWGLAFKAKTDDVRESPAMTGVQMFLEAGMTVRAHDPEAMGNAAKELGSAVSMFDDGYDAIQGADALVIFTDWPEFRRPDFERMAAVMKQKVIFDGRNLYDPAAMAKRGFHYVCVGRPTFPPS